MSALRHDSARGLHRPNEVASPEAIRTVAVTWSVSRRAMADRAPTGTARVLDLTITLDNLGPAARGTVTLTDPVTGRGVTLDSLESVSVEVIHDIRAEIHIEAPGVLHATIAAGDGSWRLVYARTPLLTAMGVPGGRAQAMSASARS